MIVQPQSNWILSRLPGPESATIRPHITPLELCSSDPLPLSGTQIASVHFVDSGVVSTLVEMQDGRTIEVGLVGSDGVVGLKGLVTDTAFRHRAEVRSTRMAGRSIAVPDLRRILTDCPVLETRLQLFFVAIYRQVTQISACNRLHGLDERLARWMLMMSDRMNGGEVAMTHEEIAGAVGTGRAEVSRAVHRIADLGAVVQHRGRVVIEDPAVLEQSACECLGVVRSVLGELRARIDEE